MGEFGENNDCGFDIAVLTYKNTDKPLPSRDTPISKKAKKSRLFLISSSEANNPSSLINNNPARNRKNTKRSQNRKRITYNGTISRNGTEYRINNGDGIKKLGLYVEVLHSIIDQFKIAQAKWGRVLALRFDLHLPFETNDNKPMTDFRKRLNQRIKREYGFKDIGYCWVREYHGKGKGQHYHWALFLDGNLIRHPSRLKGMIKQAWEKPTGGYHVPTIPNPFYFVDSEKIAQEAIYRISYLAKIRGKGRRSSQTKDYQCSRLKI